MNIVDFNNNLGNSLRIIKNLTESENIQSLEYTYYKCEQIGSNKTLIIAVY
jgi:hypothetical protein